jgi:hypothetical protein
VVPGFIDEGCKAYGAMVVFAEKAAMGAATHMDPTAVGVSKGRRIAFAVLSVLFAMASLGGLFGFGLVIGWIETGPDAIHHVHHIGYGVAYGVVLTTAFVALAGRPERKPSVFLQVVATAVATAIAALVSGDPGYLVVAASIAVAAGVLLALHPDRSTVLHPVARPSRSLGALALAGSVPLVWYGLSAARLQRTGSPLDPHVAEGHWTTMAAMAFTLVLAGLLAAARIRGWRITAWCAGLGVAVWGLASIVFHRLPGTDLPYAGSEGVGWGLIAVAGGLAFVALAEWTAVTGSGTGAGSDGTAPTPPT